MSFPKKHGKNSGTKTAIFNNLTKKWKIIWLKMRDIQVKLGVKTSDLVRKEIHGISNTKNRTNEKIWNYEVWFDDGLNIIEELNLKIIMHCTESTPKSIKFRSELGFK